MTLRFERRAPSSQVPREYEPFDRWISTEGELVSQFYREAGNYLVRFPGLADFYIAFDRQTVVCTPVVDVADDVVRNLYLNQIVPLVMGYDGGLVLHASAVAVGDRAVAFLGPAGRGKSTLAAAFAMNGHPFLTDDGLILDRDGQNYLVRPRAPRLRLWSDSASVLASASPSEEVAPGRKEQVWAGSHIPYRAEPTRLAQIFVLTEPRRKDGMEIAALPRRAAISEFFSQSFILDVEDRTRVTRLFDRLITLSEAIDCFAVDYPRQYSQLPGVLSKILEHVNGEADSNGIGCHV